MGSFPFSYANLSNLSLMEDIYQQYLNDPQSVESSWRNFFEGMQFAQSAGRAPQVKSPDLRIYHLIEAYRLYGHLLASFNPINTHPAPEVLELSLQKLGFEDRELKELFPTCGFLKEPQAQLGVIIEALKKTYCRNIGVEYMGFGESKIEKWLQAKIEPYFQLPLTNDEKICIMHYLNKAEIFESFIHTKYVGQKRFSLEGGETLIPILATLIDHGAEEGVKEVVLGMAHRGRLNVLANILNKSYAHIFHEFEDHYTPDLFEGTGDVKYHKGFVGSLTTRASKEIQVTLTANPSHLESVDPVVEGQVRAKQLSNHVKEIIPVLIHGDAAVAGQGVVYETMQLSSLKGYGTGGTIHIVVNNQIGFTTLPKDTRSTRYCTDIARSFEAPVFHVNAEDPEGCVYVAQLAIEMRQRFHCDVFIDLNCYRKYGHNESDEPTFTQPLEYQLIKGKKPIRDLYRDKLIQEGVLDKTQADFLEEQFKADLQKALEAAKSFSQSASSQKEKEASTSTSVNTSVAAPLLIEMAETFCKEPSGFNLNPKIKRLLQDRLNMVHADPNQKTIDWGMGEHLAYASLVVQGIHVRLSGQDCRRGTFSHRHAMWVDQVNEAKYFPLSHLKESQGLFDVFNSCLSEYAVLGFEFGYTLATQNALIIWEAQFGDFANGAQIIIDQYIASSEQKWSHRSNLTLMLPHGYEGQGPEHSSGRIERFLQLCGNDNMQIVNCTSPKQLFHLLRRQVLSTQKKPLIIFTPKALLRHPQCVSSLNEFASGSFEEIILDPVQNPKKLMFCSGKFYYDLVAEREKRKADAAIIRIEQLYPLDQQKFKEIFSKYQGFQDCVWVQEEHSNMGAWEHMRPYFKEAGIEVRYAGRDRSASPAAGSYALHKKQHAALIEEAFK